MSRKIAFQIGSKILVRKLSSYAFSVPVAKESLLNVERKTNPYLTSEAYMRVSLAPMEKKRELDEAMIRERNEIQNMIVNVFKRNWQEINQRVQQFTIQMYNVKYHSDEFMLETFNEFVKQQYLETVVKNIEVKSSSDACYIKYCIDLK